MNHLRILEPVLRYGSSPLFLQLICIGFALLMIWDIVSGVSLFSKLDKIVQSQNHISKVSVENVMKQGLNLNHSIFGDYVPHSLDAAGVRESTLNLKVVGVLFAANEDDSQVILQKPNGQEQFFHVGDQLPGGGVIKRITAEGVLVLHEGKLERLNFPIDELQFEVPLKPISLDSED